MIPVAAITHWRRRWPWPQDSQVEQDLVLSRALIEIYQDKVLSRSLRLRGGTALAKLFRGGRNRYSEDLDFVQARAGMIGPILTAVRHRLDGWLGEPHREFGHGRVTLKYRFASEIPPIVPLRLKIEINTREHFTVFGVRTVSMVVQSPWFTGAAGIKTYALDELLATKLRALYQRRKGRDLFDLWLGLHRRESNPARIVRAFHRYCKVSGVSIIRKEYETNLEAKMTSREFLGDLAPLLRANIRYSPRTAARRVQRLLLSRL